MQLFNFLWDSHLAGFGTIPRKGRTGASSIGPELSPDVQLIPLQAKHGSAEPEDIYQSDCCDTLIQLLI